MTDCARGCTRPCRSDHCTTTGQHDHQPLHRQAAEGLLCDRCTIRLREAVTDLPDLIAALDTACLEERFGSKTGIHATDGQPASHGKISGSPALVRLDLMVLRGWGAAGGGVQPVWATIDHWLQVIDQDLDLRPQGDTITEIVTLLTTWHTQICSQPWIPQLWSDMIGLRRALRRATNAPPPIARCWGRITNRANGGCGQLLYAPPPGRDVIVCPNPRCGRTYTGAEIIKLAIQGEQEGIA